MISALQCRMAVVQMPSDKYTITFMQHGYPLATDFGAGRQGYTEQELRTYLAGTMMPADEIRQHIQAAKVMKAEQRRDEVDE